MESLLGLIEATPVYVQLLIAIGAALLLSTVIVLVLYTILDASASKTRSFTLSAFTKRTRGSVFWLLSALLVYWFWNLIYGALPEDNDVFYLPDVLHIPQTFLYFFAGIFLVRSTQVAADTLRHRFNADDVNNLRERKILTQLQYIQRIASIVIFVVVVAFILLQFDGMRKLGTGILSTAGVGGIIIGLAAQKSIANLLAGFQIAFTQPIRLNDALIVDGEYGTVEEITLTYVTMKLWDQRRLIVPLNHFIDNTFQNWTRSSSELIGSRSSNDTCQPTNCGTSALAPWPSPIPPTASSSCGYLSLPTMLVTPSRCAATPASTCSSGPAITIRISCH
jgi:small-conductance mechanosensitive channel